MKRPAIDRRVALRHLPLGATIVGTVFALVWVLFWAPKTSSGPAIDSPSAFLQTLLDSITLAALLFIVASGFSLIFGLMRVVNMAHGAFYLLGGYIGYEIQQAMTGSGFTIAPNEVNTWEWVLPAIVASVCIAVVGLFTQQTLLRWNQGQDLRQALITIAVSIVLADQMNKHWPLQETVTWPGWLNRLVDLHVSGVQYSLARLAVLAARPHGLFGRAA